MSIGSQLKQARIDKSISIQEAAAKTKIQEKFLQALEDDNLSSLPNPIYTKGFLKKYSEFLGLDESALVEQFEKTHLAKVDQVIVLKGKELPSVDSERYLKKALLIVAGIFVFIGLLIFLFSAYNQIGRLRKARPFQQKRPPAVLRKAGVKIPKPSVQKPKVVKTAAQPREPARLVQKIAPAPAAAVRQQPAILNLSVLVKRPCHLSVKADARLIFDDFLAAGRTDQWQAKEKFELNISDASAVELALNGKRLGFLGRDTGRNILITKDGIRRQP